MVTRRNRKTTYAGRGIPGEDRFLVPEHIDVLLFVKSRVSEHAGGHIILTIAFPQSGSKFFYYFFTKYLPGA
jgi:hypothetical protein